MLTLDAKIARAHKKSSRLLQIARHRVTRWFRPAIGTMHHQPGPPHPLPRFMAEPAAAQDSERRAQA
jgi:hypothetical protein